MYSFIIFFLLVLQFPFPIGNAIKNYTYPVWKYETVLGNDGHYTRLFIGTSIQGTEIKASCRVDDLTKAGPLTIVSNENYITISGPANHKIYIQCWGRIPNKRVSP